MSGCMNISAYSSSTQAHQSFTMWTMAGISIKSLMYGWHIRNSAQVEEHSEGNQEVINVRIRYSCRVNDILGMSTAFTLADSSFLATFFNRWSIAEGVPTNSWYDNSFGFEAILYPYWTNSMNKVWSIIRTSSDSHFKVNNLSCGYCNKVWSSPPKVVNYSSFLFYTEKRFWALRNFFSFQFGRWRLRVIYVVLFVWARDAGILKVLNSTDSRAQ